MSEPIVDSKYTLDQALEGLEFPAEIRSNLALVEVEYISFDSLLHQGQILVHKELAAEVTEIFTELRALQFPIQQVVPICFYNWDDDASMAANNTSAFNYRAIEGTDRLSHHALGRAVDLNPLLNPYTKSDGTLLPLGAARDVSKPGTLMENSPVVSLFTTRGWKWLGDGKRPDWHHFEKP